MKWLILAAILLVPDFLYAGDYFVNGNRKIVQLVEPIQVYGVPATNLGFQYYYRVNPNANTEKAVEQLSEEDVERIANKTAERVILLLTEAIEKSNPGSETASLDTQVEQIFIANCARCHNDSTQRGKFEDGTQVQLLSQNKLVQLDRDQREQIWDAVDTQRMPQDHDPLSVTEVETVRKWWKTTPKTTQKKEGN